MLTIRTALCVLALCGTANAQGIVTSAAPGETYFVVGSGAVGGNPGNGFPGIGCVGTFCTNQGGINIKDFATAAQVAGLAGQFNTLSGQISAANANLSAQIARSYDVGAIASAMKDAVPNSGDRFAVRLNAAGFEGYAAGAIGVAWNVNDMARLHLNYGQGRATSVVSGGLNLSFR